MPRENYIGSSKATYGVIFAEIANRLNGLDFEGVVQIEIPKMTLTVRVENDGNAFVVEMTIYSIYKYSE